LIDYSRHSLNLSNTALCHFVTDEPAQFEAQ